MTLDSCKLINLISFNSATILGKTACWKTALLKSLRQLRPGSERENGMIGFRPSGFKRAAYEKPSSGINLHKRLQMSDFDF